MIVTVDGVEFNTDSVVIKTDYGILEISDDTINAFEEGTSPSDGYLTDISTLF